VLLVTTPDVPALRAANRVLGMWRRLDIRKVDEVTAVVNRVSRKVEVQPDLARKVLASPVASTTVPAGFVQLEAAANVGDPSQLAAGAVRKAITALGQEIALLTHTVATPTRRTRRSEAGQVAVETVGVAGIVLVLAIILWQIALTGYSFVLAGHAAREAARQLAVGASQPAITASAKSDLPGPWRQQATVTPSGSRVTVRVTVPAIVPGIGSPVHVTGSAGTVLEDRR
jgi:pilus assembly protein CpaE